MNRGQVLRDYELSQDTVEKLKVIKEKLKENIMQADPIWNIIVEKEEQEVFLSEEDITDESDKDDTMSPMISDDAKLQSTQFYFTQVDIKLDKDVKEASIQKFDIIEYLYEGLERSNGKLDLNQLENLADEELVEVVCNLEKKLSILGTYNLCCSMNNMTLEQRMKYIEICLTHLLLPKIITLEEPSRLLLSAITECVQKFPDDIQKFIFIPLLNIDLKDVTSVTAIANAFESERNIVLITEYLSYAQELKSWHLPILHNLISVKTDIVTNDKLIQLLSIKALDFAKDKNFGKLILSLIKVNTNFTDQQKDLLWEIANINQTLFKRPIQNILKTL
ncbi:uncharacterized protein LOC128879357 [Hylaeus volcanicus]|uniref:uncharacterized protein LOC128879357 n=1 Tax=Hylaeus volcanicus TaxID=313075 RepID=UPI0023B87C08|nr:uncharacterized protein LOC128879357 [Hylaeus volcanicus]